MTIPDFLYQKILPDLQALERIRKFYLFFRMGLMLGIIFLLSIPIFYVLFFQLSLLFYSFIYPQSDPSISSLQNLTFLSTPSLVFIIPYSFMGFGFLLLLFQIILSVLYSRVLKLQGIIIPEVVKNTDDTLHFSLPYVLQDKKIIASELFTDVDRKHRASIISKGLLEGDINQIHIEISDICVFLNRPKLVFLLPMVNMISVFVMYIKNLFSRGKDLYSSAGNFRGLFMIADFPKKLHGFTLVLPDKYEKYLGFLTPTIQRLLAKKGDLVYLEDPRFEQKFKVYSTDQIEARYVLSFHFMEKITRLQESMDRPLLFCFKDQKFYTAIPMPEGLFELDLNYNVTKKETVERIYYNIEACLAIVRALG